MYPDNFLPGLTELFVPGFILHTILQVVINILINIAHISLRAEHFSFEFRYMATIRSRYCKKLPGFVF